MYEKAVDKRRKAAMTAFLQNHFRYNTMNSCNHSTSYANNIKLHQIKKPQTISEDTWWSMLEIDQWQDTLKTRLDEFGESHNWQWQAGINGRSGGYVVLYRGGIKPSGYQSYCTACGQMNFQSVSDNDMGICGRCGTQSRVNFNQTHRQVFTWPGKFVDMDDDFKDWSMSELRERVELVQAFDRLCDDIVTTYTDMCLTYTVTEDQIWVPKTIKVLQPIG